MASKGEEARRGLRQARRIAGAIVRALGCMALLVGVAACGEAVERPGAAPMSPLGATLVEPCPERDGPLPQRAGTELAQKWTAWDPQGATVEKGPFVIPEDADAEEREEIEPFGWGEDSVGYLRAPQLGERPLLVAHEDLAILTDHLLALQSAGSLPPRTELFVWDHPAGLLLRAVLVIADDDAAILSTCDGGTDALLGTYAERLGVTRGDLARRLVQPDPNLMSDLEAADPLAEPTPLPWRERPATERNLVFPDADMPGAVRESLVGMDLMLENVPRGRAVDSAGEAVIFLSEAGWSGGADLGAADDRSGSLTAFAAVVAPAGSVVRVGVGEPTADFDAFTHEFVMPTLDDAANGSAEVVYIRFGDDGRIAEVEVLGAREAAERDPTYEIPPQN